MLGLRVTLIGAVHSSLRPLSDRKLVSKSWPGNWSLSISGARQDLDQGPGAKPESASVPKDPISDPNLVITEYALRALIVRSRFASGDAHETACGLCGRFVSLRRPENAARVSEGEERYGYARSCCPCCALDKGLVNARDRRGGRSTLKAVLAKDNKKESGKAQAREQEHGFCSPEVRAVGSRDSKRNITSRVLGKKSEVNQGERFLFEDFAEWKRWSC